MMHPHTSIRFISDAVGVGVIATQAIPRGTVIWAPDPLDQRLSAEQLKELPAPARERSLTYMYRNAGGEYVLLWDHAKYVNHSFHPNSMPTPYGCEIALRDIGAGEEITGDYGMLNIIEDFEPEPDNGPYNRAVVRGDDLARQAGTWDAWLAEALADCTRVEQPLWDLLPMARQKELQTVTQGKAPIRSVLELLYKH